MITKKFVLTAAIVVAVGLMLAFMLGRCSAPMPELEQTVDTVTVVRVDTLRHTDVQYRDRWRVRVDTLVQIVGGDTLYVPIPIDKHIFTDDTTYRAEVSGYNVSMDRMEVFRRTVDRTVTIREAFKPPRPRRWGLGVQVGYGAVIDLSGGNGNIRVATAPYIGVGLSYNFLTF